MKYTAIVSVWSMDDERRGDVENLIRQALRKMGNDFEIQYCEEGGVKEAVEAWKP